jgi:GR25 family glycosyltransferase involved in LPS biosynthesis
VSIAAFIIHLERSVERKAQAEKLVAVLPCPAEIVAAVDGRNLTDEQMAAGYRRSLHKPRYPFELTRGEIACMLSHRLVWRAIIERGLDAGLIVEDDVAVEEGFTAVFAEAARFVSPGDYIRFPRWERGESGKTVHRAGSISIVEPFLPMLGTQAQLVGREAARLLLAATETFDRPIDSLIQMQWLHGARVLSARPIAIREIDRELGGTVLQKKKKSFLERVEHELRRPLMRSAVARRNRRWRRTGKGAV